MLRSSLCDYTEAYILVSATITVPKKGAAANPNNRKNIKIKNCASFTNCISKINNTKIDNAKDIDLVMPIYDLIEYSANYFKTSKMMNHDESFLHNNSAIADFLLIITAVLPLTLIRLGGFFGGFFFPGGSI